MSPRIINISGNEMRMKSPTQAQMKINMSMIKLPGRFNQIVTAEIAVMVMIRSSDKISIVY